MRTVKAMVHSLQALAEVEIISENGNNNVIAKFEGKTCTAIYNVFVGIYYVDDVYGILNEGGLENERFR